MENRNPFHERQTPVRSEAPLLIACSDPAMFARAHLYALDSCRTSVLVPPHETCRLDDLLAAYPMLQVLPPTTKTLPCSRKPDNVPASSLPSIETIPSGIAPGRVVAVLLTSGTTGRARLVEKTFAMFACEAASLSELFCREDDAVRVVTTVPLEHMFGYQYGFFWPRLADMESSLVPHARASFGHPGASRRQDVSDCRTPGRPRQGRRQANHPRSAEWRASGRSGCARWHVLDA